MAYYGQITLENTAKPCPSSAHARKPICITCRSVSLGPHHPISSPYSQIPPHIHIHRGTRAQKRIEDVYATYAKLFVTLQAQLERLPLHSSRWADRLSFNSFGTTVDVRMLRGRLVPAYQVTANWCCSTEVRGEQWTYKFRQASGFRREPKLVFLYF